MKILKIIFPVVFALLAACQSKPSTYTFSGQVVLVNNCNRIGENLPVRVKIKYTLYSEKKEESAEQVIDLEQRDDVSMHGVFSIQLAAQEKVTAYTAIVTRPNGNPVCSMLPCPSAGKCDEKQFKKNIPLGESTSVSDTLEVNCNCGF